MAFKVTPEYLASASAACQTTATDVSDELTTCRSYVVGLEDSWGGIASNTFQEMMQLYDACAQALNQALTDIGTGLQNNFVNYSQSEQDNITKIQNIENELSGAKLG